jgi:hypothetical protein
MGSSRLRAFWRSHRILVSAFAFSAALAFFFLVRFVVGVIYWQVHENEPIRPWMTVGYVGRSWDLNPGAVAQEAGLPPRDGRPLTFEEIADRRGVPVQEVIGEVEAAVVRLKAAEGERLLP